MNISQEEAEKILEPHKNQFRDCVINAWNDYNNYYSDVKHKHSARTRANILYDHMVDSARLKFDGMSEISLIDINGSFLISIGNMLIIRFKKLDNEMKSRNYPTQQALAFMDQLTLPGIPVAARLIVGYQLNELQTNIKSILVTCPNGSQIDWHSELKGETSENLIKFPGETNNNQIKRIKIKKGETKKGHEQEV